MLYDAAIIGAGPAGCAAAIALARSGFQVLLIEASPFPRHRPGETLHPGVEPIFETLGVAEQVNAAGFLRHSGHRVIWNQNVDQVTPFGCDVSGEWRGYQAERAMLDGILLRQAIACGAQVRQPCRVQSLKVEGDRLIGLETSCGPVRARYILDGSGRTQWLSRQLGLQPVLHSHPLRVRYGYVSCPNGPSPFDLPLMQRDADGWTWAARIRPDRCAWVRMRFDGIDPGGDWRLPQLLDFYPAGLSKAEDVTWRISECVAGENWFLMGDAACILDPASSHGVLKGLMSGLQAAHFVAACRRGALTGGVAAQLYSQWLHDWFDHDVSRLQDLYWGPQDAAQLPQLI